MRKFMSVSVLCLVLFTTAQASAFDAYKDRRGPFVGVGIGGGLGGVKVDQAGDATGLDDSPAMGLHADLALGVGLSESFTASIQGNLWLRTVKLNDFELTHQHLSALPTIEYFLLDGLHLSFGAGLGYAAFDTVRDNRETYTYRELGLATKIAAGYEFFANGTIAAGVQLGYTAHFYSRGDFNTLTGGITFRWY